jgi:hypothetical protein
VASPFDDIQLAPSEPMPATSTARLVSSDGSHIDLVPMVSTGDLPVILGFTKPKVVLHTGGGYTASVEGLVDFAGNSGASGAPLRIGSIPTPPLVSQDGFESETGSSVGGALIIREGSSLSPVAGSASAYIGPMGAPVPPGTTLTSGLLVRLARQPSDTKLRFSYREVGPLVPLSFDGSAELGSVDGSFASTRIFAPSTAVTQVMLVPGIFVSESDLQVMEVALPDSAATDLVVSINAVPLACTFGPNVTGLLIDDLRLE